MNYNELNKILESYINEISDETKASYLAKRQAQVKSAEDKYLDAQSDLEMQKAKLNRADKMLNKADLRQIEKFPDKTDLDTAREMLNTLKSKMKKIDDPRDWEIEEIQEGNYHALNLYVRGWGEWVEREEDDDQAPLSDKYKSILQKILIEVQKQYGIKIINQGSEKKGLSFDVIIENPLENPKFGEWIESFDEISDIGYALSIYADVAEISMYKHENEDFYVRVIIQDNDLPHEIDISQDFNHVPSIEEIKKLVLKYFPEYTKIKNWNIPNVPSDLVSRWNWLIENPDITDNAPHKFSKWEFGDQHGHKFIATSADTAFASNHEIGIIISKYDDYQYEMSFYGSEKLNSEGKYLFKSVPALHQIKLIINVGSDIDQDYGDVDFDSIPEIPKRLITKL